jgi:hypothetical protein
LKQGTELRSDSEETAKTLLNLGLEVRRENTQLPLDDPSGNRDHAMQAQDGGNSQTRSRKVGAAGIEQKIRRFELERNHAGNER